MDKDNALDERQKELLARAIKTYNFVLESKDPAAASDFLINILRSKTPGDPANPAIDKLMDFILENVRTIPESEEEGMKDYLLMFGQKIKEYISEKLNTPDLKDDKHLVIHIERKWEINAQIEKTPPYHIYFSTNLFRFCIRISELFISDMVLNIEDDDPLIEPVQVPSRYSNDEVVQYVREVLVSFLKDNQIHLRRRISLSASHVVLHSVVLLSNMAFILCHEFGHAIINDCKNNGTSPPFSDGVKDLVMSNFNKIIDKHDKENQTGLKSLTRLEQENVFSNWVNEINADIISASLLMEYQKKNGPWKDVPGILGITYMAVHLSLMAQYFLFSYLSYFRNFPPISKIHPPFDFRMHCVLLWMYGIDYGSTDAFKAITAQGQRILGGVLRESSES